MRITSISVKQLFGVFNHFIAVHSRERVTLIHGPNGFGKTVILRMIAGVLEGKAQIFEHTPFSEFCLTFDDGTARIVRRRVAGADAGEPEVKMEYLIRDRSGAMQAARLADLPSPVLSQIDAQVPGPYQLVGNTWTDDEGHLYGVDEILEMFPDASVALPPGHRPIVFFDQADEISVFLIETNRLGIEANQLQAKSSTRALFPSSRIPMRQAPSQRPSRVQQYSDDLVQRIRSVLAEYAKSSQESDRTFPERLVRFVREGHTPLPPRDILDRMNEIENKRRRLISLGLLDSESGLRDLTEDDIRRAPEALTIYVGDVQEKLRAFDDLAGRIGSLMDILNDRFQYKNLRINRQRGFRIVSNLKQRIDLEDLSSGEQHQLVVLYELLFLAPKNALVLVDEPEISLHVAWQSRFLSDLIDILGVTDAYAIVATHSPVVIGTRWDLTVELKGPEVVKENAD